MAFAFISEKETGAEGKKLKSDTRLFTPTLFSVSEVAPFTFVHFDIVETTFLGFCDLSPYTAAKGRSLNPECCCTYGNQFSEQILLIFWLFYIGPGNSTTPFIPTLLHSPWPEEEKKLALSTLKLFSLSRSLPSLCPLAAKQQSCFVVVWESVGVVCCSLYPTNQGRRKAWCIAWYLFLPCLRYVSCPAG